MERMIGSYTHAHAPALVPTLCVGTYSLRRSASGSDAERGNEGKTSALTAPSVG
jgi:hypothetical protein